MQLHYYQVYYQVCVKLYKSSSSKKECILFSEKTCFLGTRSGLQKFPYLKQLQPSQSFVSIRNTNVFGM